MKSLYLIGGPMGVGKTTISRQLLRMLPHCAFLDGDWCWTTNPFTVTEETRAMVMDNITHVLTNFLRCTEYENVVFCWVMHQQQIIDDIRARLPLRDVRVVSISLITTPAALTDRIRRDIAAGCRDEASVERSLSYLPLYGPVKSVKLDVSDLSAAEAAEKIRQIGEMHP